ncbi:hypothetical protein AVEN_43479-1 [Araneus ventricosus]|uniref:Uncharacterized protein n=1 Tax=Araneus ventricosus TaxID=182803 RepID=A0A4Y2GVI5_ARAVE|nr:hypothetical protein AVEN_43479-1 [Araneus ventricosus]
MTLQDALISKLYCATDSCCISKILQEVTQASQMLNARSSCYTVCIKSVVQFLPNLLFSSMSLLILALATVIRTFEISDGHWIWKHQLNNMSHRRWISRFSDRVGTTILAP